MALLTTAQLKSAIGGIGVDDTLLQAILDANEAALIARWGAVAGPLTQHLTGGSRIVILRRPASSITSVTEVYAAGSTVTLAVTDWQLRTSGMSLLRLPSGRYWADVDVVYTPVDDTAERKRIQLALSRLDVGLGRDASQTIDGSTKPGASYTDTREAILNSYTLPRVP